MLSVFNNDYNVFKNNKMAKQRAKQGFCERDAWEINTWFLEIMPKMLTELKNKHQDCPLSLMMKYYEDHKENAPITYDEFKLHFCNSEESKKFYDEAFDYCFNQWNNILDQMIYLFTEASKSKSQCNDAKTEEYYQSCKSQALTLFATHFDDLWW